MVSEIIYFSVFVAVGAVIVTALLGVQKLLQTKRPSEAKLSTYECGILNITDDPRVRIKMRYYIFGLLLIIFDVEMIFIFPWAVAFNSLGIIAFLEMMVFIAILLLGLLYAWRKGVLKWI